MTIKLPVTDKARVDLILQNPSLVTKKEKAAAIYGIIAFIAFSGEVARAKKLAKDCGVSFEIG